MPPRHQRLPLRDQLGDRGHEGHLADLFRTVGYIRTPNLERRHRERARYKKGWEVRLVVRSEEELAAVRQSLLRVGATPGAPFRKHHQIVQPVYGRAAAERLLRRIGRGAGRADARGTGASRTQYRRR